MFYTDTNGKVPEKRQFLLVLLESEKMLIYY